MKKKKYNYNNHYNNYNYNDDFINTGVIAFKRKLDKKACKKIIQAIRKKYKFGKHMFKTEKEFNQNTSAIAVNPAVKSNNFALKLNLDFIEKNKYIKKNLKELLGKKYKIMLKKFVVQMPENWIPLWVKNKIKNVINPNLNKYILPEYQQLSYFRGVDFHQDLIEHKMEKVKFITFYIYLNKISKNNSPLNIIERSFEPGAQKFPHPLKKLKNNKVLYMNKVFKRRILTGDTGRFFMWSCLNLHGAGANNSKTPRISLRYKIRSNSFKSKTNLIDKLFEKVSGPKFLKKARTDVNEKNFREVKFRQKNESILLGQA